jgi:chemotaxis protein MotB
VSSAGASGRRGRRGGGGGGGGGHDGSGSMRWLLTYADLITLLMVFFTVLYSMSRVDAEKYKELAGSLHKTLNTYSSDSESKGAKPPSDPKGGAGPLPVEGGRPTLEQQGQKLTEDLARLGFGDRVTIYYGERGLTVALGPFLFELGKAELRSDGMPTLDCLSEFLKTVPNHVSVEGFTDNLPINTAEFPSNWELSSRRATAVIHYLTGPKGLPPDRFLAVGYGEYRPAAPNDSEPNRAQNRRVDIVILAKTPMLDKGKVLTPTGSTPK